MMHVHVHVNVYLLTRLPQSLQGAPLKTGDVILEINGIAIVDQNQTEVQCNKNYPYLPFS